MALYITNNTSTASAGSPMAGLSSQTLEPVTAVSATAGVSTSAAPALTLTQEDLSYVGLPSATNTTGVVTTITNDPHRDSLTPITESPTMTDALSFISDAVTAALRQAVSQTGSGDDAIASTVASATIGGSGGGFGGDYGDDFNDPTSADPDVVVEVFNSTLLSSPYFYANDTTARILGGGVDATATTSALQTDSVTVADRGVGAILQVLLEHASAAGSGNDATAAATTAAAELVDKDAGTGSLLGVTSLADVAVTSDMQYAVVTNVTNLTIDLLTNATYRGVLTLGDAHGSVVQQGGDSADLGPRYALHEGILIGIILSLIVFFSIAGNVVVCIAIMTDRNLRKTSNYFIVSLAVADMLVASMVMSFAVANDILGYWVFGETFCSVWISLDIMCSTASIVNLCAISLDRYVLIRSPLHYETWVTPARTLLCISAVWILSALISFLPIHLGWHQLGLTPEPTPAPTPSPSPPLPGVGAGHAGASSSSSLDREPYVCFMELNPWYAVVSSIFSFYMPCLVMIAIYLRLYAYARRHVSAIKTQTRTPMLQQNGSSPGKGSQKTTYYKMADHKAAITLGVIMGTFLFCWTPFFTINIVGAFCPVCIPTVVFQVFTWLGYFNSTLNPIIYSIFNKEFREAFIRVLNFRRCCPAHARYRGGGSDDFRRPIKYTETYGTVVRKSSRSETNNEVTAV